MALARGKHFIWISAALRSSNLRPGRELSKTIDKACNARDIPESRRLEGGENKERKKLEGGRGGQHTRLVDALNLKIFFEQNGSKKSRNVLLTSFHRSIASTQTLMKASRASARLEFNVLS